MITNRKSSTDSGDANDDIFSVSQSQNIAVSGQKLVQGYNEKLNAASNFQKYQKTQKVHDNEDRDTSYDYAYYDFGDQISDVFDIVGDFTKTNYAKKSKV